MFVEEVLYVTGQDNDEIFRGELFAANGAHRVLVKCVHAETAGELYLRTVLFE